MSWLRTKSNKVVIFIDFICLAIFMCFMALMLAIALSKVTVWAGL